MTEPVDLLNFDDSPFGTVPFLKNGYIINLENGPLEIDLVLGQRRHWHIHTVRDHEVIGLTSLSDDGLEELIKFMAEIRKTND